MKYDNWNTHEYMTQFPGRSSYHNNKVTLCPDNADSVGLAEAWE